MSVIHFVENQSPSFHYHRRMDQNIETPMITVVPDPADTDVVTSALSAGVTSAVNVRTSSGRNSRTHLEVRKSIISGVHNVKEAPTKTTNIRTKDIVKIFTSDDRDEYLEVTPEELERVKFMHEKMEDGTTFSFNYNCLLFVASMLAGLGLISNSVATIIASMLVSPLMGPVIGLAYGSTIRDWKLVRKSVRVEIISLVFCIVMGILIAAVTGPTDISDSWPTQEMLGRGTKQNFLIALPVAFFSGLGVAVSVLDDQTSSLVGVAISASLLPPAVNAGILWIAYFFAETNVIGSVCDSFELNVNNSTGTAESNLFENEFTSTLSSVDCENLLRIFGSRDSAVEIYYRSGFISLMVTIANILLIWISSMLMFRMKEVLPIKKNIFWDDLSIARKVYQSHALIRIDNVQESDIGFSNTSAPVFHSDNENEPTQK